MHFTQYFTRLAAYAVVVEERASGPEMLLSWWNGEGRADPAWSLPGGGIDLEETAEQAAVRELLEETGYDVALGPILAVDTLVKLDTPDGTPFKSLRVLYEATVTGGELGTLEVGGSTDEAAWHPIDDVPGLVRTTIVDVGLDAWRARR